MSVLVRPNHPARLVGVFVAAVAACALVAAAAGALIYLVADIRSDTPAAAVPAPAIAAPAGVIIVRPVADAAAFEQLTGFAPVVPSYRPPGARNDISYAVSPADAAGARAGRVTFLSSEGTDGVAIVLVQRRVSEHAGFTEDPLHRLTDTTPTFVSTLACGDLSIGVEIYFTGTLSDGDMNANAATFVAALQEQCRQ